MAARQPAPMPEATPFAAAEAAVTAAVGWLRLGIETAGALVVALGVGTALVLFARGLLARRGADFTAVRLVLARYLALALELQLAADILSTAVAPSWERIGQLGAIAVIRTALNFFLSHEMKEEERVTAAERGATARAGGG